MRQVVAAAAVAALTPIPLAVVLRGRGILAAQLIFMEAPTPVVVVERARQEVRALAEPRAVMVALALQAQSLAQLHIMVAVEAVAREHLALGAWVVAAQVHRRPETLEQRTLAAVVAVAVRHLAGTGLVAQVVQESPSSLTLVHNARPVARSPVRAA